MKAMKIKIQNQFAVSHAMICLPLVCRRRALIAAAPA